MGKKIEVDNRLLLAADRMYDAIDEVLKTFDLSPFMRKNAIAALRPQLQQAKAGYDAAMVEEEPT